MTSHLQTLRAFLRTESAGFIFNLVKNSASYIVKKYFLRQTFAIQNIHDYQMKLNLKDPGISRTLYLINDREREHSYLLKKITKPAVTVLDLGANIGYYALMESRLVGPQGTIIAIEPHPENFQLLSENIKLNKSANIIPKHAAVTDQDGSTTLHVSKLSNVHSVLPSVNYSTTQTISVPAISLASIAEQYPNIAIIRMDIEGFETVILESLITLNQNHSFTPTILFELHTKKYSEPSLQKLRQKLATIGYKVNYLATSNQKIINDLKIPIVTSIATDGKTRHIVKNITAEQADELIPTARCLVLAVS